MSYDIEGWENNEGSGSNWLDDVVVQSEPNNYVPPGYSNGAWDTGEHFSYEPGLNSSSENDQSDSSLYVGRSNPSGSGSGSSGSGLIGTQGSGNSLGTKSSSGTSSASKGSSGYANSKSYLDEIINKAVSSSSNETLSRESTSSTTGTTNSSQTSSQTGTTNKTVTASKDMPTYGELPTVPEYNEDKIRGLRQKHAATGISSLRNAVQEAITRSMSVDNPYLRKTLMKSSLEGFGGGLGKVMDSAETTARAEYDTEYKGNLLGYNAELNRQNSIFQAAMQDYIATMSSATTSSQSGQQNTSGTSNTTGKENISGTSNKTGIENISGTSSKTGSEYRW